VSPGLEEIATPAGLQLSLSIIIESLHNLVDFTHGGRMHSFHGNRISRVLQLWIFIAAISAIALASLSAAPQAVAYSPSPVANVTAVPGNGTLTVSWTAANPGASPYSGPLTIRDYLVRATRAGSYLDWRCTTTSTTCTITGLENGVDYWIEVKATNSFYYSSTSTGNGPWRVCCSTPSAPGTVTATTGDGSASVSWTPPTNAAAAGGGPFNYRVTSSPAAVTCDTQSTTCDFPSGLINGVTYTFWVTAAAASGTSAGRPSAPVKPVGLPGSPLTVFALLDRGKAEVNWSAPASDGGSPINQYVVQATPGGQTCTTTGGLSCVVSGLSNGQTYTFTVTALNAVGSSQVSAPSSAAKLLAGPGRPTGIKGTGFLSSAKLKWSAPKSTGGSPIKKYTVTVNPGGKVITTKKPSVNVKGLNSGTSYTFVVRAFNSKGPGLTASSKPIRTKSPAVPAPTTPPPVDPEPAKPAPSLS
jgi:hypothetical protein